MQNMYMAKNHSNLDGTINYLIYSKASDEYFVSQKPMTPDNARAYCDKIGAKFISYSEVIRLGLTKARAVS